MVARRKTILTAEADDERSDVTVPVVEFGSADEQEAGWEIVAGAMNGNWRSVGPYGPRADLYDRP